VGLFKDYLNEIVEQTNVRNKGDCRNFKGIGVVTDFPTLHLENYSLNYCVVSWNVAPIDFVKHHHGSFYVVNPCSSDQKEGRSSLLDSVLPVLFSSVILFYFMKKFVSLSLSFNWDSVVKLSLPIEHRQ
jgi:hypothetical protein